MAAAFNSIIEEICLFRSITGNHFLDCRFKLCGIEFWFYLSSQAGWESSSLSLEDSFHESGVGRDAFVHTHLKAAEHNRD
jgi:hypothetical protein